MVAASKCEGWALQKNYLVPHEILSMHSWCPMPRIKSKLSASSRGLFLTTASRWTDITGNRLGYMSGPNLNFIWGNWNLFYINLMSKSSCAIAPKLSIIQTCKIFWTLPYIHISFMGHGWTLFFLTKTFGSIWNTKEALTPQCFREG